MRIIYADSNYFTIYHCGTKAFQTTYDSLEHILLHAQVHDYFLLPEYHFIFTSKSYVFYSQEPFSLKDFKKLLQDYVLDQKKQFPHINQLLHQDTHDIKIDNQTSNFLLWHKGQIRFQLDCIFWSNTSEIDFSLLTDKKVALLPCSYGALKQCNTLLNDNDYSILYINNNQSKLIQVKNQFYSSIHSINFWKETLKLMYQEHNLLKYYRDPNSTTPVTESIVKDVAWFFAEKLVDRFSGIVAPHTNMIIISDITKNTYCMEALKKLYSQFINGYILPMSLPNSDPGLPLDITATLQLINKKTIER